MTYSCSRIVRSPRLEAPLLVPVGVPPTNGQRKRHNGAHGGDEAPVVEALVGGEDRQARLLEEARREAETIREEARLAAARLADDARQAGWSAGHAAGVEAARAELRGEIDAIRAVAAGLIEERSRIIRESEPQLVALALAVAQHVVRDLALVDARVVKATVAAALKRVGTNSQARVKLHPADLAQLDAQPRAATTDGVLGDMEFVADDQVERGGCLVEFADGVVDARLEAQFAETVRYFQSLLAAN